MPTPTSFYKKFLLDASFDEAVSLPSDLKRESFQILEVFLQVTGDQVDNFIRRSGRNDTYIYLHEMRFFRSNERIVRKRQISAREFIDL